MFIPNFYLKIGILMRNKENLVCKASYFSLVFQGSIITKAFGLDLKKIVLSLIRMF